MNGPRLPLAMAQRGGDVDLVHLDIRSAISAFIGAHPRSLQRKIGPSEIGTPCKRKLAYKVSDLPGSTRQRVAWRPAVGTAVHTYLEGVLNAFNESVGETRFLTETPVDCGVIGATPLTGSVDVYDVVTATVVDFKIVGPTSLRKARLSGASALYRTQVHTYGRGFVRAGWPVDHVAILWLPSAGEITDAVFWSEPYDESVATEAIAQADALATAIRLLGPDAVIPSLPRADDWCQSCPWFSPTATPSSVTTCPGAAPARAADVDRLLGKTHH